MGFTPRPNFFFFLDESAQNQRVIVARTEVGEGGDGGARWAELMGWRRKSGSPPVCPPPPHFRDELGDN